MRDDRRKRPEARKQAITMLPGPVFNVELLTTSRRPRYFVLRAVYGLALLTVIWQNYLGRQWSGDELADYREVAAFATSTFHAMILMQAMLVLAMTPSLLAGVIANERQRKTLHYLLASCLTSTEIVIGKLTARLLHIAVFLAIGLPVMSLLSLVGGVDPVMVLLAFGGTFTMGFLLAALSVYCSTISKRVRGAITSAYAIEGVWLVVPVLLKFLMPFYYPRLNPWVAPLNDWVYSSTPWAPLLFRGSGIGVITASQVDTVVLMMGLQLGSGVVLLALAILRLRPFFQSQEGSTSGRWLGLFPQQKTRAFRLFPRKPVGDDPVLWKELHTTRTSGAAQITSILLSLMVAGMVLYWAGVYGLDALAELRSTGNGAKINRENFNSYLRFMTTAIGTLAILAASVAGANVFTTEKEDDTWLSLIATPLSGLEIVRAKVLGILWSLRWPGVLLAILWGLGLVAGSIHPLGVVAQGLAMVVFVSFAAVLGTWISLRSKSSWKSQALTTAIMATLMGGYLCCLCPLMNQGRTSYLVFAGVAPFIEVVSLVAPWEVQDYSRGGSTGFRSAEETSECVTACVVGILAYGAGAVWFWVALLLGFDRAADRPQREYPQTSLPSRGSRDEPSSRQPVVPT